MAFALPVFTGIVVASFVVAIVGQPSLASRIWLPILGGAVLGGLLVDYLTRKLPQRAGLLDLQLEFPERTPTRADVLLRAQDLTNLRKIAAHSSVTGSHNFQEAAEVSLAIFSSSARHVRWDKSHSERVGAYTDLIAQELRISAADRDRLRWAALLHDIGKFTLPSAVTRKKRRLSINEREMLQSHAVKGALLISPLLDWLGGWGDAVPYHHELWDGTGYPEGLEGDEIPVAARIVAVADAFDMMTTGRWQSLATMTHAAARSEIAKRAESSFDPTVVRAFMNIPGRRLRRTGGLLNGLRGPWLAPLRNLNSTFSTLVAVVLFTAIATLSGALLPAPDLSAIDPAGLVNNLLEKIGFGQEPEPTTTTTTTEPITTTTRPVRTTTTTVAETTTTVAPTATAPPSTTTTTTAPPTTTTAPPTTTTGG